MDAIGGMKGNKRVLKKGWISKKCSIVKSKKDVRVN